MNYAKAKCAQHKTCQLFTIFSSEMEILLPTLFHFKGQNYCNAYLLYCTLSGVHTEMHSENIFKEIMLVYSERKEKSKLIFYITDIVAKHYKYINK